MTTPMVAAAHGTSATRIPPPQLSTSAASTDPCTRTKRLRRPYRRAWPRLPPNHLEPVRIPWQERMDSRERLELDSKNSSTQRAGDAGG